MPALQNKNENSSGSVIPVKKDVNAAEPKIPAANFLFLDVLHGTLLKLLLEDRTS